MIAVRFELHASVHAVPAVHVCVWLGHHRAHLKGFASIILCHDGHCHEPDQHGAGTA